MVFPHLFQYLYMNLQGYIIFLIFPIVTETAEKVFQVALKFSQM